MSFWKYFRAFLIFDWLFGDSNNSNNYNSFGSNNCNSDSLDDLDCMGPNFNNDYSYDNHNIWDDNQSPFLDDYDDYDMMDDF